MLFLPVQFRSLMLSTTIAVALGTLIPDLSAFAADTLPTSVMDHGSVAKVSDADIEDRGTVSAAISISGADQAATQSSLFFNDRENDVFHDGKADVLRSAHQGSVLLGFALLKNLGFSLGIHGSFEDVSASDRDVLVDASERSEQEFGEGEDRLKVRQTGFSGATLFVKWQLYKKSGMGLALAPFVESGAGEQATYALTRSVEPKAGWMVIGSYGAQGVGQLSLNAGYRYRNAEEIGGLVLRNELFYKGVLKVYLSRHWAVTVGGTARKIMVAEDNDSNPLDYQPQESGEATLGLFADYDSFSVSTFATRKINESRTFGFGRSGAGLALAMKVGSTRRERKPRTSYADEVQEAIDADKIEADKKVADRKNKKLAGEEAKGKNGAKVQKNPEYSEMIGTEIDPLDLLADEKDEFTEAQARAEADRKDKSIDESEKVAAELKKLRDAETKAANERKLAEKKARELERAQTREQISENERLRREYMEEANEEIDEIGGISDQEMNWNGLEGSAAQDEL